MAHHPPADPRMTLPQLHPTALYGLAGDIVRAIEPHTEAHNAALLATTLVCFGNAAGHGPHALAQASRHTLNLFAALVGLPSRGRKGSSWMQIKDLFARVDPAWLQHRTATGPTSGEGLVYQVRDRSAEQGAEGTDAGVSDKRLLLVEEDFAAVLKAITRQAGTLSSVLAQAWDSGDLRVMTKTNARATGAHISILAHVAPAELLPYLRAPELPTGCASRFLWVLSNRSKLLPDGGGVPVYGDLVPRLQEALEWASRCTKPLERDQEARAAWRDIYPRLGNAKTTAVTKATSRAEAQILRLSSIYAMLDCSPAIRLPHLHAALGFWRYVEDGVAFLTGYTSADPVATRLLAALRAAGPQGHGKRDLHGIFNGHLKASQLAACLAELEERGLIARSVSQESGRTHEIYVPT